MKKSNLVERFMTYTLVVLAFLVLISSWMTSHIYARYITSSTGSDSARVAIFGHSETITPAANINSVLTPGNSWTYDITITNGDIRGTSEVAQSYNVEVVTAGNLPLQYKLEELSISSNEGDHVDSNNNTDTNGTVNNDMSVNGTENTENSNSNSTTYQETQNEKSHTFKFDNMYFEAGTASSHSYKMTVTWPEANTASALAGLPDFVQINVNVEQVD